MLLNFSEEQIFIILYLGFLIIKQINDFQKKEIITIFIKTLLQNNDVEDHKGEYREEDVEKGIEPENIDVEIQRGGPEKVLR